MLEITESPQSEMVQLVKAYCAEKMCPVPINYKEKAPKFNCWQNTQIDVDDVEAYFSDSPMNVGILLGQISAGIIDIDLDCDEVQLIAKYLLPDTNMIFGRGSRPASHYIYRTNEKPLSCKKYSDVDGSCIIEIRSDGQQTIFPPSTHPSGEAVAFFKQGKPSKASHKEIEDAVRLCAVASLAARHWPNEGQRHSAALALSGLLCKAGFAEKSVVRAIEAIAGVVGDPEVKDRKQAALDTWKNFSSGKPISGTAKLEEVFGKEVAGRICDFSQFSQSEDLQKRLLELNDAHAVTKVGGSCRIMNIEINPQSGLTEVTYSSASDFKLRYQSERYTIGYYNSGKPIVHGLGGIWLDFPNRREFAGVMFSPGQDYPGYYNLYQGFPIEPIEGDCSKFVEHIVSIICDGDTEISHWLFAWMANIIQHPEDRPGTAIVLRGKQGTGKSIALNILGKLFGIHYSTVSQPRHLSGNFNSHLQAVLLLQVEEAFWAGDKQTEGVLKDMITGDTLNIEKKGVDVTSSPNFMRIAITSNHDWVIPAGMEERRFLVLDVSEGQIQNKHYFASLLDQMNNGGYEALYYMLQHFDYSDVDLRTAPNTHALWQQKLHSLDPISKFWFEVLTNGSFYADEDTWPEYIRTAEFRDLYYEAAGKAGQKHKGWETEIGQKLLQLCPAIEKKRKLLPLSDNTPFVNGSKKQQLVYVLPDLETCRNHFNDAMKTIHSWQEGDASIELKDLSDEI